MASLVCIQNHQVNVDDFIFHQQQKSFLLGRTYVVLLFQLKKKKKLK